MKKPLSVIAWERRVEELRAEIPVSCHTCEHGTLDPFDGKIFCRRYNEEPPADFAEQDGVCSEWSSVLEAVPF